MYCAEYAIYFGVRSVNIKHLSNRLADLVASEKKEYANNRDYVKLE